MEKLHGGTQRSLFNMAQAADPRERNAYQRYLDFHRRIISDREPMSFDQWREASAKLFRDYLPTVTRCDE